jgi:hypothetical protein
MKHVHHVLNDARGLVPIKGSALYRARRRVIVFHVMSAAPACSLAVINVPVCAVKIVLQSIAKSAE